MKIVFDAERMKYPHTGLFHYCLNLGKAIGESKSTDVDLYYFLKKGLPRYFGSNSRYLDQSSLQKIFRPSSSVFDIWHSNFQLTDYFPRSAKTKLISTIHDLNFLKEGKSRDKTKYYLKKIQKVIDRSSEVVAISNYVKSDILEHCKIEEKNIHVIYNGSNIREDVLAISRKQKPLINGQYIYSIGTINKKKNFHVLLNLLIGNDLKLVISGIVHEPQYQGKIEQLATHLGVNKRVLFTGPVSEEDKYNYMLNCAIFAFPSIAEGFGLPVIEAMSLGKKVLLSTHTSLPEIGGSEAFYLDSMESDYLTDFGESKIMNLIKATPREKEIQLWASQFTWKAAADSYLKLYMDLKR